jgi:hypothetical protein
MRNVLFKDTPIPNVNMSAFDLSHERKMSGQIGRLLPFVWFDIVPGDRFKIRSEVLVKFAPMLAPVLHRVDVYTHYFFVPYRLCMPKVGTTNAPWDAFITQDPETEYTNEVLPYVTINEANKTAFQIGYLSDYFGLPPVNNVTTVTQAIDINVLPFLAYHIIYDDYYRDENLTDKVTGPSTSYDVPLTGGDLNSYITDICGLPRVRCYEKDYFRGALPEAYYGSSSDVELDLDVITSGTHASMRALNASSGAVVTGSPSAVDIDTSGYTEKTGSSNIYLDPQGTLSSALEIMELRRAMALTRYLEAMNRGGKRYPEYLLGVFGVDAPSALLDYPQYIGGGRQAVQISSVLNMSQVLDPTAGVNDGAGGVPVTVDPQSLETGRGLSVSGGNTAGGYFREHGILIGLVSVLPRTAYGGAQIEKFWRKSEPTDFFVPQLQNIGDQEILQSEIGYDATGTDADNVFGYAPRWAEYKFKNSTVHGEFLDSLDYWHMSHIGDTSGAGPDLNTAFVGCYNSADENERIFADQTGTDSLYFQIYNDVKAIRPMQTFDVPK